jgi:hypothetical protein
MARYGGVAAILVFVGWVLLGRHAVRVVLGPEFAPVFGCTVLLLLGGILFSAASACQRILLISGRAGWVAIAAWAEATVILVGLALAIAAGGEDVALRASCAYLGGSVALLLAAYSFLGAVGRTWLPMRRTFLLWTPAIIAWPALGWETSLGRAFLAFAGFAAIYLGAAIRARLLPWPEIRSLHAAITNGLRTPAGLTVNPRRG